MDDTASDAKPEVDGEKINLKVVDQENTEVHFKVKFTTKFEKIITAYCAKKGIDPEKTKFLYDGVRLVNEQTPKGLEMEDGDCIQVFVEQLGGRS
mmetsp:Transcript_14153/g.23958  ORF Transcript_14153/g.23958 Transcript_14153/m.23958 type:complete len:95 (+) Transcript_14153:99-383(+)|eukprot:CAMPEP_0198209530 /NCGR_PEP_ID=MMETSP1445-20131203/16718_1 /TAXON_ID=36898 /ORGANISM="Pyramimonas sp., Strain CCMP2087" /LENGTH=94 /DNA_ID=CAMNT_0043883341 /DNA_START=85 /DNA_END=369 /DNA_ORIENTATION=-